MPIQVWSTKSFTATWHAPLDQARPLLRVHDGNKKDGALSLDPQQRPVGTLTWNPSGEMSNLGVELQDTGLIYDGQLCRVGTLKPGEAVSIDPKKFAGELPSSLYSVLSSGNMTTGTLNGIIRNVLFDYGASTPGTTTTTNTSLRSIDQRWRVEAKATEEAILVGRLAPLQGQAEDVSQNPTSVTRLWLGKLPNSGERRDRLVGTLKQDTYVRVYIPVRPAR